MQYLNWKVSLMVKTYFVGKSVAVHLCNKKLIQKVPILLHTGQNECSVLTRVVKWGLITREFSFSFSKFEGFWGWGQGFQNFWGFFEAEGDVKVLRVLRIYPQKPSHFEVRMRARLLRFFEEFSKILEKWSKKALKIALKIKIFWGSSKILDWG